MRRILTLLTISVTTAVGLITSAPTFGQSSASEPRDVAYVTNFGGDTVSVVDLSNRKVMGQVRTGKQPHGVAFSPDGK